MFPGWLQHHVTPTQHVDGHSVFDGDWVEEDQLNIEAVGHEDASGHARVLVERVSFSFNVPGDWDTSADVNMKIVL